ncbi:MAG: hypothetical protein ACOCSF_07850 [Halanaeroarchaeum sp.]
MSGWFSQWNQPAAIALLVGIKIAINASLTLMVSISVGERTFHTVVMGGATALSAVVTVLLLGKGGLWTSDLGQTMSNLELLLQLSILVVAGYVVYSRPSSRRIGTVLALLGAVSLFLYFIPIYGEAFVAP